MLIERNNNFEADCFQSENLYKNSHFAMQPIDLY